MERVVDTLCRIDAEPLGANEDLLVARARRGDREATEQLLRSSYGRIYGVCRRMTGSDTDAADAAQEAMISIVRALPRFDGRSRFSTWAYRIAVNASIDEVRRRSRRRVSSLEDLPEGAPLVGLAPVAGGGLHPLANVESVADAVDVDAALLSLPEEFRAAVVLRDLCGLDYAEIAEVLSVPPGTVRSRIARGRSLLADRLRPEEDS